MFIIRRRRRWRLGANEKSSKEDNDIQMSFENEIYSNCENVDNEYDHTQSEVNQLYFIQKKCVEPEVSNVTEC